jgi:8-oxo-dGTP diphosphatase
MENMDSLEVYTVSILSYANRYLLLQRNMDKSFAPGRWSGLGGHVEANEYDQLRASALREVQEEAGIEQSELSTFCLRRVLLVSRPKQPFRIVLYYTGILQKFILPDCPEGILNWKSQDEFDNIDVIETTRPVLDLLIHDMEVDPHGIRIPNIGLAVFNEHGVFERDIWSQA